MKDRLNYERILADCGRIADAERVLVEFLRDKPNHPLAMNNLAWLLAFDTDGPLFNPPRAVGLARKAVAAAPEESNYWNTLGLSLLRAGDLSGAAEALETSMRVNKGGTPHDWFLMAIVHAKKGDKATAEPLYKKGLNGLAKNPADSELATLRDEAAEALGLVKPRTHSPRAKSQKVKLMPTSSSAAKPSGPFAEDAPRNDRVMPPIRAGNSRHRSQLFEVQ